MYFMFLADGVVLLHFMFVLFVVLGGLLVFKWPWVALLHLPSAVWAVLLEFNHWICPLTPLEQQLRMAAGQSGYSGGFIDHYLVPLLYPAGPVQGFQNVLGGVVIAINILVYGGVLWRRKNHRLPLA